MVEFRQIWVLFLVLITLGVLVSPSEARHRHHAAKIAEAVVEVPKPAAKNDKPPVPGDMQSTYLADMKTNYWDPITQGQTPLIIFSHSFGGCNAQSSFLMAEFAKHGWLVMAPNHGDAKCKLNFKGEKTITDASWWNDKLFLNRRDDMKRLYRKLRYDPAWKNRIDWSRVAVIGNGLGAYTALALAGGHASWKMDGLAGVLAISPTCAPLAINGKLENISTPVMYFIGAKDGENNQTVKQEHGCFDRMANTVAYVEFERASSSAFTDVTNTSHAKMANYAIQFFDSAFSGKPMKLMKTAGISEMRQK
jgi:dienelactone hydrolase